METKETLSFHSLVNTNQFGMEASPKSSLNFFSQPKFHINPNFYCPKISVVHVNPLINNKNRKIHVNPRVIKDLMPSVGETTRTAESDSENLKCPVETTLQHSVHINPLLMRQLSSRARHAIDFTTTISQAALPESSRETTAMPTDKFVSSSKPTFVTTNKVRTTRGSIDGSVRHSLTPRNTVETNAGIAKNAVVITKNLQATILRNKNDLPIERVNIDASAVGKTAKNPLLSLSARKLVRVGETINKKTLSNGRLTKIIDTTILPNIGIQNKMDMPPSMVRNLTTSRPCSLTARTLKNINENVSQSTKNVGLTNSMRRWEKTTSPSKTVAGKTTILAAPSVLLTHTVDKTKYKRNAYKIDRTTVERGKRKRVHAPDAGTRNVNQGLITIGGVKYKSSRTQLVRSVTVLEKKKIQIPKVDNFVMAKNGKKLHRLLNGNAFGIKETKYTKSRSSFDTNKIIRKRVPNSVVQTTSKNILSYKAKQRSLQILRDKLRKNFIPCLIYRRYGYCANHANGTCSKLHDKKQVALCKNFLQGKCLSNDCPMSHAIGPEKMPTCKYFLDGCCIRDDCPYVHVKVSSNTRLCGQFLRGYCADGDKCKQRHAYICPEYENSGKCSKGKYCPYPHKHKLSSLSAVMPTTSSKKSTTIKPVNSDTGIIRIDENRKRYYDENRLCDIKYDVDENCDVDDLKSVQENQAPNGILNSADDHRNETTLCELKHSVCKESDKRPTKRPLIGNLPAYIPIN